MSKTNIIPLAGDGTRFSKEGYILPKALLPVSGKPMIIRAIDDMPSADKWIFFVRAEHIERYGIDFLLKKKIPGAIVVPVEKTTEGQACTCLLAKPFLDDNDSIFIASCDNGYLYAEEKYNRLTADERVDSVVWTFTKQETLRRNPTAWGWAKIGPDRQTIEGMSVKIPVSEDPFNDHAVVASFFFKKASDFISAAELMLKENYRINNEFYVDALPIFLRRLGKRTVFFDVDLYVGWGTPKDLYDFHVLEYLCSFPELKVRALKRFSNLALWEAYFQKQKK